MMDPSKGKTLRRVRAACKRFLAKRWPWILATVVVVVVVLIYAGYWASWTGFGGYANAKGEWQREKTLWDWLDLLIVPVVLALGAALFTWVTNRREREAEERRAQATRKAEERRAETDREIALDRSREAALQAYLDRMTELMEKGLGESAADDPKWSIARARTLTVLRQLDTERKGLLLRFLHEAALVRETKPPDEEGEEAVVFLGGADLRGADLRMANLWGIDMHEADLSGANLSGANLHVAVLSEAVLSGACLSEVWAYEADLSKAHMGGSDLRRAVLSGASMREADLREADLSDADLRHADLSKANLTDAKVTFGQLRQAKSLKGAIMPDGTVHE